jgi:hypothetical protein
MWSSTSSVDDTDPAPDRIEMTSELASGTPISRRISVGSLVTSTLRTATSSNVREYRRPSVHHVLLTRFNLARGFDDRHLDAEWLERRLELFALICAPSVEAQTSQDFTWIVFVDPASPKWLVDGIASAAPFAVVTEVSGFRARGEFTEAVRALAGQGPWLTSRLDNDDALARDFIERARAHAVEGYLSFAEGAQLDLTRGRASLARFTSNSFLTRRATDGTVLEVAHRAASPLTELEGSPAWLVVAHGGNVMNGYGDPRPISARDVETHFGITRGLVTDRTPRWARRMKRSCSLYVRGILRRLSR